MSSTKSVVSSTTKMMEALVNFGPEDGQVELREVPVPEPGPGEVLLRVKAVGVCGSDLHQYHGTQSWPVRWPVTLGHEFCGEVAEVGEGVEGWEVGDRVACETAAEVDGTCAYCRTGRYNLCPNRLGFGYGTDGAAATFVVARQALLHSIPENVSWEEAALAEPSSGSLNAVLEQSSPRPGDVAVVIGPGTMGLLCVALLAAAGVSELVIVGLERDAARLELAREFGATHLVMNDREGAVEVVRSVGDGLGADLVIDAAGVSATLKTAVDAVRPAGQITKLGWGPQPPDFSLDPIVQKAVTLRGSFSHTWVAWERVLRLMGDRKLDVRPLVNVFPLSEWKRAFELMEGGEIPKAVLVP